MKIVLPNNYDRKVVKKFALFPITIHREIRWLEWVVVRYYYDDNNFYPWTPEKFIDINNTYALKCELNKAEHIKGFSKEEILEINNTET